MRRALLRGVFVAALVLIGTARLQAAGGVIEINQAAALAGGVTAGDAPGFPVTLSTLGSYELTGNLDVRGLADPQDQTAIEIREERVTLDLKGFAILGPVDCGEASSPISCLPAAGSGIGITSAGGLFVQEVTIRNGSIRGMGGLAIDCSGSCKIEDVRVEHNGGGGINLINGPGVIVDSLARRNGGNGFRGKAVFRGNVAHQNAGWGIFSQGSSVVSGNSLIGNQVGGLRCADAICVDNTLSSNGIGIEVDRGAAYGRNMLNFNTGGNVVDGAGPGAGIQVDINACGSIPCP
jgi:hypothetical protein